MSLFEQKAPWYMERLIGRYGLTVPQACGPLGNAGVESGGFTDMTENAPHGTGRGPFQWSGARAQAYEALCRKMGVGIGSDEAAWAYMSKDFDGQYASTVAALKRQATVAGAVTSFMNTYERPAPATANLAGRIRWGNLALAIWDKGHGTTHPEAASVVAQAQHFRKHVGLAAYHGALASHLHHHGRA